MRTRFAGRTAGCLILHGLLSMLVPAAATAQTTSRVSVTSSGYQADDESSELDMTPDGRYIVFASKARNLTDAPGLYAWRLFWHDRQTGTTRFIAGEGHNPSISDDGQLVAFTTSEPLLPGDTSFTDVFVWSAVGAIHRISGNHGGGNDPHLGGTGRYLAYKGSLGSLAGRVILLDRLTGHAVDAGPAPVIGTIRVSRDGRYVAYPRGDSTSEAGVFVYEAVTGMTSVAAFEGRFLDLSADGSLILLSVGTDLFVRDVATGVNTQVNMTRSGRRFDASLRFVPRISRNGQWVTLVSAAPDLVPGDTNGLQDTFVWDRTSANIARVSMPQTGREAAGGRSWTGVAGEDGVVAFVSDAHNLVPGDSNFVTDVFVRDPRGVASCAVAMSPTGLARADAAGGGGSIAVTAAPACTWTVAVTAPWIHVTSSTIGSGNATITYTYEPVGSQENRAGAIVVNTSALAFRQLSFTRAPIGSWDTPQSAGVCSGSVAFTGWALADVGVSRIRIHRDAVAGEQGTSIFIGDAVPVAGARPDVVANTPEYPFNTQAGWGLMVLSNILPNQGTGRYTFRVFVDDVEGRTTSLGSRAIQCDNAVATTPFGAIDTPAQGQTVSGTIVNFGWALTPQSASIPSDGSTLSVFIDGVNVGRPSYGYPRSDIATLFPGYANSNGPVGFFTIDTTAYADGVHTIAWVVTDNLGRASGIGSRYFTIQNGATPVEPPFLRRGLLPQR